MAFNWMSVKTDNTNYMGKEILLVQITPYLARYGKTVLKLHVLRLRVAVHFTALDHTLLLKQLCPTMFSNWAKKISIYWHCFVRNHNWDKVCGGQAELLLCPPRMLASQIGTVCCERCCMPNIRCYQQRWHSPIAVAPSNNLLIRVVKSLLKIFPHTYFSLRQYRSCVASSLHLNFLRVLDLFTLTPYNLLRSSRLAMVPSSKSSVVTLALRPRFLIFFFGVGVSSSEQFSNKNFCFLDLKLV